MEKRIISDSEDVTRGIAREVIERYKGGAVEKPLVLMLYGNLGVGKTIFMKEIGRALGLEDVVSPAFVVYFEYVLKQKGLRYLYHFDLYRVDEASEFDHLGVDTLLQPGNVIAIEWSEKASPIEAVLREKGTVVEVHLEHAGEDRRMITIIEPGI